MSTIQPNFNKFYENLRLTSDQKEDAKTKYNGVCEKLHNHYYGTKYDGSTKLLFGSYGKRTNIRPPRDVDVLFKIPKEIFERYNNYHSNGQSQLLQDIREVLSEKYTTTDKISAWGKVVLVQFADGTHNIELLPAYEQQNGSFLIPNSENGGSWETFNPKEGIDRINKSEEVTNGLTRKLVRMSKKWVEESNVGIKSYNLEDYVMSFLISADLTLEIQHHVHNFFNWLKFRVDQNIQSKIETALDRSTKALDFERSGKIEQALDEWVKIFGNFFPKNTEKANFNDSPGHNYDIWKAKYPSTKEQDLTRDCGIPINIDSRFSLEIDATVPHENGFRSTSLIYYIINKLRLKKLKSLTFRVTSINVPGPYDLYWKIRNYGDEAGGDLRGEITKDNGSSSKYEHTKYYGVHTVECYCVKNNQCVAYTLLEVPIGND